MIVSEDDFTGGITAISHSGQFSDLGTFLTPSQENKFIKNILGFDLGQAFIDDLLGSPSVPQTQKWTDVFIPFDFEVNGFSADCIGIHQILIYLFYDLYVSQQAIINQSTGNGKLQSEATEGEGSIPKSTIVYNRGVNEIDSLQYFICQDPINYPDPKPQIFEYQSPF